METLRLSDISAFYHISLGLAINIYRINETGLSNQTFKGGKKMRYTRLKKKKSQKKYVMVLVMAALLFAMVYFGLAGLIGSFISGLLYNFISDVNPPEQQETKDLMENQLQDEIEPSENEQQQAQNIITDDLVIEALTLNAVQVGAFANRENAEKLAMQSQIAGGAGFILLDHFYRVITAAYTDIKDAENAKEVLETQGFESGIYTISYPGASIEVTASSEKVQDVKEAFTILIDGRNAIAKITTEIGKEEIKTVDAIDRIRIIKTGLENKLTILEKYKITQQNVYVLDGLINLYEKAIEDLALVLSEDNIDNHIAILSKIRYTYISMIYDFKLYMEQLTDRKGE
jgi:hypothetical protein